MEEPPTGLPAKHTETALAAANRPSQLDWPVAAMNLVRRACEPGEPLEPGDERYKDFSPLRQGVGIGTLKTELNNLLAAGRFHHSCLCGHRGSGKSTELLSLEQWADERGFLTVHTEVDEHFGIIELEFSDLFLLAATVVEAAMQAIGHPLPQEKIRRVIEWFGEVIQEDKQTAKSEVAAEVEAQLGSPIPFFGKLMAKFTAGAKAGTEHVMTARRKIRNYPETLIELTNDLLQYANETLIKNGWARGLLLLFDNLDRYEPERIDRVLFKSSDLVRRMECHAVFTIPIALEYEPLSGTTQDCFGFSLVLPMLSLRGKSDYWNGTVADSPFDAKAVATVREALAQRIDLERLFVNPADADLLIKMSGGCIRDLMHLVTLAFGHTAGAEQFSSEAVQKAIRQMRATYIRRLTEEDYQRLAEIARRKSVPRDKLTARLLFNRWALEYLDEQDEPWVDVHPLVVETERFRDVYAQNSPFTKS